MSSKEEGGEQPQEIDVAAAAKAAALARIDGMSKRELARTLFARRNARRAAVTEAVGIMDSRFDIVRINGNSLSGKGVSSGDYVLLQKDIEAAGGDAVIVEVNGRQYAKILGSADDGIELYSCGGGFCETDRMHLPLGSVKIIGVVISYFKEFRQ